MEVYQERRKEETMKVIHLSILTVFFCFTGGFCTEAAPAVDFDSLMGKGTAHWQHVKQESDIAFLQKCKEIYEKNIALKESVIETSRIPHTVHFIWLGPKAFPPKSVENIRTWMAKNPGWKFVFWTDSARLAPCSGMEVRQVKDFHFTKLGDRFVQSDNWGEKSDLLRYEILLQEGGVYVDHDANCLRPFDELHNAYDMYCCLETPHSPFVGQNLTCGNGVIGSKPGHATLQKVIDLIDSRWDSLGKQFRGKDSFSKEELVMQRTYIALTDVLKQTALDTNSRDIVLPSAYFFAKSGIKSLYSKHFYANSWADNGTEDPEWEKMIASSLAKMKTSSKHFMLQFFVLCALSLISVVMLCAIFIKVKKRYFSKE